MLVLFALHSVEVHSVIINNIIQSFCWLCVTLSTVGAFGTDYNSIIFKDCNLYAILQIGEMNLPKPRQVDNSWKPNGVQLSYMIVGNAAFGILRHILRPYARSNMTHKKKYSITVLIGQDTT